MSLDETSRSLDELADEGKLTIIGERDGEPVFALTQAGKEHVERLLDQAIDEHGDGAAEAFADALDLPAWMAEDLIEHRLKHRGAQ